MNINAGISLLM